MIAAHRVPWKGNMVIDKDCALQSNVWYHPELQLQIISEWNNREVVTVWDLLNHYRVVRSQNESGEFCQSKSIFFRIWESKNNG